MQFIDLQAQYKHLKTKIDKRIQDVLEHGKYIMGPEVQEIRTEPCPIRWSEARYKLCKWY